MAWDDFNGEGGGGTWQAGNVFDHTKIEILRLDLVELSSLQYRGSVDPEGAVTAPQGSIYRRSIGGYRTTLYVKTTGAGSNGWTPLVTAFPAVQKGNLGATPTFDFSTGNVFECTLNANVTGITLSNAIDGQGYMLILQQDATGGRTVTGWPAAVRWPNGTAPTITPTALKRDVITLRYLPVSGIYLGAFAQNY